MKGLCWRAVTLALAASALACPPQNQDLGGGGVVGGGGAGGGGGGATDAGESGTTAVLVRPSRSSSIALSDDDALLAAVNPDNDSLSIFNAVTRTRASTVSFPAGSMPVSVAIHPDGQSLFVVLRKAQRLVRVRGIDKLNPAVDAEINVGSEPTGVALSPTGGLAVVPNFGEDTITVVDTGAMQVRETVRVGPNPRAVAITNDLDADDADEKAYVTRFFGEVVAEADDEGRVGKVVEVDMGTLQSTGVVKLAPIADTGFAAPTASGAPGPKVPCAPNQLFNIAINGAKAYVTHVCVAPEAPVFKFTNVFSAVSVVDLPTLTEDVGPTGTAALSRLLAEQGPATASLIGVPVELDFKLGTNVAYVASQAADKVQRVHYKGSGDRGPIVLGPDSNFAQIDLRGAGGIKVPIGIVVAHTRPQAFVNNWIDRSVTVIDLALQSVDGEPLRSEALPASGTAEARVLAGKKFFFTGTGRWADRGVSSCGSCHPDGNSDNITWSFAAGPRQSTPLDGTFSKKDPTDQRALNWTAIFDEIHDFELNTRGTSGGKGAIVTGAVPDDVPFNLAAGTSLDGGVVTRNDFLSGSTRGVVDTAGTLEDWNHIDEFIRVIPANQAPTTLDPAAVQRGRATFQNANCHACHGGAKWTISRVPYVPSAEKNGSLPGVNGEPAAAFGLRVEDRTGGTLPLPNPDINVDTKKVAVERIPGAAADGGVLVVGPERITCVLRNVGTFTATNPLERKGDGSQAQGALGFNPPSLLGLATSAPYFHHGEAKTLEDVFSARYAAHHQAGNALFLANGGTTAQEQAEIADLVAFLRSIDLTTAEFAVPSNMDICGAY